MSREIKTRHTLKKALVVIPVWGTGQGTKTDEFLEQFQTAVDPTAQNGPYLWKSCAATKSDEFFRKFIPFGSWTWTLPLHHFHWILTSNYGTNDWQIHVTSLTNTKRQWQIHKTSVTNARNNFKEILEISWHRSKNSSLTTAWESAHFSSLSL